MDAIVNFLVADIRMAMPILIAAIGLIYSERAGVVNIGAEGIMLIGALAGVVGSYYGGNQWAGAFMGAACGALVGLVFAFLVITARANQVVVGVTINILGLGLTTTIARIIFGMNAAPPTVATFNAIKIPVLGDIPIIGPLFFNNNALVYFTIIMVAVSYYVLFKTEIGLKIRAVGENPKACDTVGINVYAIRYGSVIFGGVMCGLAGSYVSLGLLSYFTENMVAGRGFIALAAVVFGKWNPLGAVIAVLVFGAGEALQFRLQAAGTTIPYQFMLMIPYILTTLALAGVVGKAQGPASSGVPYVKE